MDHDMESPDGEEVGTRSRPLRHQFSQFGPVEGWVELVATDQGLMDEENRVVDHYLASLFPQGPPDGRVMELQVTWDKQWLFPSEEILQVHTFRNGAEVHVLTRGLSNASHTAFYDLESFVCASSIVLRDYLVVLSNVGVLRVFHVDAGGKLSCKFSRNLSLDGEFVFNRGTSMSSDQLVASPTGRVALCPVQLHVKVAILFDIDVFEGVVDFEYCSTVDLPSGTRRVAFGRDDSLWTLSRVRDQLCVSLLMDGVPGKRSMSVRYKTAASLPVMSMLEMAGSPGIPPLASLNQLGEDEDGVLILSPNPVVVTSTDLLAGNTSFKKISVPEPITTSVFASSASILYMGTDASVFKFDPQDTRVTRIGSLPADTWHIDALGKPQETLSYKIDDLFMLPMPGPSPAPCHRRTQGAVGPGFHGWGTSSLLLQKGTRIDSVQGALCVDTIGIAEAPDDAPWVPSRVQRLVWVEAEGILFISWTNGTRMFSYREKQLALLRIRELEVADVLAAGSVDEHLLLVVTRHKVLAVSTHFGQPKVLTSMVLEGTATSASVSSKFALVILDGGRTLLAITKSLKPTVLGRNLPSEAVCTMIDGSAGYCAGSLLVTIRGETAAGLPMWDSSAGFADSDMEFEVNSTKSATPYTYFWRKDAISVEIRANTSVSVGGFRLMQTCFKFSEPVFFVGMTYVDDTTIFLSGHRLWAASNERIAPLATPASHGVIHAACATKYEIIAVTDAGLAVYTAADDQWNPAVLPKPIATVEPTPQGNIEHKSASPDSCKSPAPSGPAQGKEKPRRMIHVPSQGVILALSSRPGEPVEAFDAKRLRPLKLDGGRLNSRAAVLWEYVADDGHVYEYLLMTGRQGFDRFQVSRTSNSTVELRFKGPKVRPSPDDPDPEVPKYIYAFGSHVVYGGPHWLRTLKFTHVDGRLRIQYGRVFSLEYGLGYGDAGFWSLTQIWGHYVLMQTRTHIGVTTLEDVGPRPFRPDILDVYTYEPGFRPDSRTGTSRLVRGELCDFAFAGCGIPGGIFFACINTKMNPPSISVDRAIFEHDESDAIGQPSFCPISLKACRLPSDNGLRVLALMRDSSIRSFFMRLGANDFSDGDDFDDGDF